MRQPQKSGKDKEKNFKKKQKIFLSRLFSSFSNISSLSSAQLLLFRERKKKLKKKKKKKEKTRRTQKNHKEPPHLFFSNNHKTRTNAATKVIMRLKDEAWRRLQ